MSEDSLTIGEKICFYRKRAGMSQLGLEIAIGAAQGSISRIENNWINPTKQTLEKIISVLDLSAFEASDLYNIDVNIELKKYVDITKKLNSKFNLDSALNLITTDLINYVNGKFSVIFLWNKKTNVLEVSSLNVPPLIRTLCGEFIGYSLDNVKFDLIDPEDLKNFYVRSFTGNKLVVTNSVYEASYPLLSRSLAVIAKNIADVKLIVAIPMNFEEETIGVLGIVLNKGEISNLDREVMYSFSDLITSAVYRMSEYGTG